jgi:hypothetical protein
MITALVVFNKTEMVMRFAKPNPSKNDPKARILRAFFGLKQRNH